MRRFASQTLKVLSASSEIDYEWKCHKSFITQSSLVGEKAETKEGKEDENIFFIKLITFRDFLRA